MQINAEVVEIQTRTMQHECQSSRCH